MPREQRLLEGLVFMVVDGTVGLGRTLAGRLCVHGARVAVVGVVFPGRTDDAAASAALLCKEMTGPGSVALPYRLDLLARNAVSQLLTEVREDLGPASATVVVIPPDSEPAGVSTAFRGLSADIASRLPAGCRHLELEPGQDGRAGGDSAARDSWALRVFNLLFSGPEPYLG